MSFQQGLSGLNASSKNLEVIGNNIANANTYGAKSSRVEFSDVYANSLSGAGTNSVGIGVTLQAVSQQFTQGNVTTTENPMDLAINGAGFFQVTDGRNPVTYTRNGQFKVDRDGFIVNNQQEKLMGYPATNAGVIMPGRATPLQLPTGGVEPVQSERISLEANFDSRAPATFVSSATPATATTPTFDPTDPTTYNNATSQTVYDQKGQEVAITYYFQKVSGDRWNVYATANGTSMSQSAADGTNPVSGTNPLVPRPVAQIAFPANGGFPVNGSPATTGTPGTITAYNANFASPTVQTNGIITLPDAPSVTLTQGGTSLPITGLTMNLAQLTQYGAAFGVTSLSQDGNAPGTLTGLAIEGNGVITARYSNGLTRAAGQLEIATFRNPQGLKPLGGNTWSRSYASGEPVVGVPGDGGLGALQSGALEESNVDLTAELVNMITAQRVYQANAQTIKTQDQVLQTLVNLR